LPGGLFCAIGNPLSDGTWTYTWQNGRQLARMHNVDIDASFVYNENGLRVQKTVNGVVTNYTLHGKNVVHMKTGNDELHFFYDAQNKPAVVVYNGTPYSYVKNLQGDIVAILDSTGSVVVSYVYDAWGKPISKNGTLANTLGTLNPFRYRSYVFDEEVELYYLRSRYYNPSIARFVSADAKIAETANIYAYCNNAPIMLHDPNGFDGDSPWYDNFKNKDDTYSLYDNDRFRDTGHFHEQFLVVTPYTLENCSTSYNKTVGFELDAATGGWEWEHVDVSLLDVGHVTLTASASPEGYCSVEAMASVWSPSVTVTFLGIELEVGAEVLAIGGGVTVGQDRFSLSAALGWGLELSLDFSNAFWKDW